MRLRILLLFICFLTFNASCVGPSPTQGVEGLSDLWAYDSIQFEIAPLNSSSPPDQEALDWFRDRLHDYRVCDKARISFSVQPVDTRTGPPIWDINALVNYTARRRTLDAHEVEDRRLRVFVPYIVGVYLDYGVIKMLGGIQYGDSTFAVFKDGAGDREPAVLLHEFGHMIGLADSDTHKNVDPAHTSHCANNQCAMFWSTPGRYALFDDFCLTYIQGWLVRRNAKLY